MYILVKSQNENDYSKPLIIKYEKRLQLKWIHNLKSDLINNMDYMRISGNKTSSVILIQTKYVKSW